MGQYIPKQYSYSIPINEPDNSKGASGTVTVLYVSIQDDSPIRRGRILARILKQNYGLNRNEAKLALRAMEFDNIVI